MKINYVRFDAESKKIEEISRVVTPEEIESFVRAGFTFANGGRDAVAIFLCNVWNKASMVGGKRWFYCAK